jgi:hypothetical protein
VWKYTPDPRWWRRVWQWARAEQLRRGGSGAAGLLACWGDPMAFGGQAPAQVEQALARLGALVPVRHPPKQAHSSRPCVEEAVRVSSPAPRVWRRCPRQHLLRLCVQEAGGASRFRAASGRLVLASAGLLQVEREREREEEEEGVCE